MSPGLFRANAPQMDAGELERDLTRIPGISSSNVVLSDAGQILGIHVVGAERDAASVRRDVQTLLAARWGLELAGDLVSVLELDEPEAAQLPEDVAATPAPAPEPEPEPAPVVTGRRGPAEPDQAVGAPTPGEVPRVVGIALSVGEARAEVRVTLSSGSGETVGAAYGSPSQPSQRRLVASATLEALLAAEPTLGTFSLDDLSVNRIGDRDVVVSVLCGWRGGADTTAVGAVPVGPAGELRAAAEAVVRALLPSLGAGASR